MAQGPTQPSIALALRVLDHQIVGSDKELVGNVDNLALHESGGDLLVTGLLSGPPGLGARGLGGLGRWMTAIWRRLHPDPEPRATVLPMSHVVDLGSAVTVSDWAVGVLDGAMGLEHWLRRYVVSRIPGAGGGEDRLAGEPLPTAQRHRELQLEPGDRLVSELLGARVRSADGEDLGRVLDVGAEAFERTGQAVGRLRVSSLTFGPHGLGAKLGYSTDARQGPRLVAAFFHAAQRDTRRVPLRDVAAVDWAQRVVTLSTRARPVHPHADR